MPVNTSDREAMRKLDDASRQNAVTEQHKRIREASTGPAMNHAEVNDALDRIEALQKETSSETYKKPNPSPQPGGLGGPSQNPAVGAATRPYDPNLPANPQVPA